MAKCKRRKETWKKKRVPTVTQSSDKCQYYSWVKICRVNENFLCDTRQGRFEAGRPPPVDVVFGERRLSVYPPRGWNLETRTDDVVLLQTESDRGCDGEHAETGRFDPETVGTTGSACDLFVFLFFRVREASLSLSLSLLLFDDEYDDRVDDAKRPPFPRRW